MINMLDPAIGPMVNSPKCWHSVKPPETTLRSFTGIGTAVGTLWLPWGSMTLWITSLKRLFNETWDPVAIIFSSQQVTLTANWVQWLNLIFKLRIAAAGSRMSQSFQHILPLSYHITVPPTGSHRDSSRILSSFSWILILEAQWVFDVLHWCIWPHFLFSKWFSLDLL